MNKECQFYWKPDIGNCHHPDRTVEKCDKNCHLARYTDRNQNAEGVSANPLLSDVCHWNDEWGNDNIDCDSREYETTCGHNFYFNNGDVMSNEFKYCPWCGKHITITVELGDTL